LSAGGNWSVWSRFAGSFDDLAAQTNADGRMEVFGVAPDGAVSHKWQRSAGDAFSSWTPIGGTLRS
jgi:hypothetical protein